MRIPQFVATGIGLLLAACPLAQAQTAPVPFHVNCDLSGERIAGLDRLEILDGGSVVLVYNDEAETCYVELPGSGGQLPPKLVLGTLSVSNSTPDVTNEAVTLTFTASGTNFRPNDDLCSVSVSGSGTDSQVSFSAPIGSGNVTFSGSVTFNAGASAGQRTISLNCSRNIEGYSHQSIPATAHVTLVNDIGGGSSCDPLPGVFTQIVRNFDDPMAQGGWGYEFGTAAGNLQHKVRNTVTAAGGIYLNQPVTTGEMKSWRFTAPANKSGQIYLTPGASGFLASISKECPGKFTGTEGISTACRKGSNNGPWAWTTQGASGCVLEAGEVYYLNVVNMTLSGLSQNPPLYLNNCGSCSGTTCECPFVFNSSVSQ